MAGRPPRAGTTSRQPERDGEGAVLAKVAEFPEPWRAIGERLHALVGEVAPELTPRLWYGMPAYARGRKTVCFFRAPQTFGERYLTLGFTDEARLDDGLMWPTAYAILDLGPDEEAVIRALLRRAAEGASQPVPPPPATKAHEP